MTDTPKPTLSSRLGWLYKVIVRSEKANQTVLGLLGLWGSYYGISNYLKHNDSLSAAMGVTLGVLAIICAVQGLAGSSRVEQMCSWRLLITFYCLFQTVHFWRDFEGSRWALVLLPVILYFGSRMWRRAYVWGGESEGTSLRPRVDA